MTILVTMASWVRPHISDIALALVATLLVIFGGTINDAVRRIMRGKGFWLRVLVFVALCTFGYGLLSVWLTPIVEQFLRSLSPGWLLLTISGSFVGLGMLAQYYRQA